MDQTEVMTWVLRFAWVLIFLQWVDIVMQAVSLRKTVLPAGTNLADREALGGAVAKLLGRSQLERRARHLLEACSRGWDPRGIVELLAHQNLRETLRLCATGLFILLVLVSSVTTSDNSTLAWLGIGVLGATLFLKGLVLGRIDAILEGTIVSKLPSSQMEMTISAEGLGDSIGNSIQSAFKNYLPHPEQMASSVGEALERARKAMEATAASLGNGLSGGAEKMQSALSAHAQQIDKANAGLATQHDKTAQALAAQFEKASQALSAQVDAAKRALESNSAQLSSGLAAGADKMQSVLTSHGQTLEKANQALAAQLEKIASLGSNIEKVLHVQQSVDTAVKGLSASEEFKKTLSTLQSHLQESDRLLKEVSKPRTIRLVEQDVS